MTIKEQITKDLQDAMKSGDTLRKETLRMARSAIKYAEIERIAELDDAGVQDVLRKEIKQRRESVEEYERAKRMDLADKERAEATILEAYLPTQMTEDQIEAEVRAIISETGAHEVKTLMPAAMARMKGKAEGRLINKVVTRLLAEV